MTTSRDHLTKADTVTIAAIETEVPALDAARQLVGRFHTMIRAKTIAELDTWIEAAENSLIASFARGTAKNRGAVGAAIREPWSNGQTEGQVNKLKLVKRQMYGRPRSICSKRGSLARPECPVSSELRQSQFCMPIHSAEYLPSVPAVSTCPRRKPAEVGQNRNAVERSTRERIFV
jgi:hypothetical protein